LGDRADSPGGIAGLASSAGRPPLEEPRQATEAIGEICLGDDGVGANRAQSRQEPTISGVEPHAAGTAAPTQALDSKVEAGTTAPMDMKGMGYSFGWGCRGDGMSNSADGEERR
jgi:hypothetical protein